MKKIYTTFDYDKFKTLVDNREVKQRTTSKIIESIHKVGYITNPIIVNERMEVIDGQNRLEALKELNMPVDYIVVEGATIKHCRALNINQSNWTTMDYIRSYADGGNASYRYLVAMLKAFPKRRLTSILFATSGYIKLNTIREGGFKCDAETYNKAYKSLRYLNDLSPALNKVEGRLDYLECAILYAYSVDEINTDKLANNFRKYAHLVNPIASLEMAIDELERIYNYRNRDKVYLKTEYLKDADHKKLLEKRVKDKTRQRSNPQGRLEQIGNGYR